MCDLSLRIIKNEFTEDIFNKELWPGVILFNSILAKSRLIVLQEASDLWADHELKDDVRSRLAVNVYVNVVGISKEKNNVLTNKAIEVWMKAFRIAKPNLWGKKSHWMHCS